MNDTNTATTIKNNDEQLSYILKLIEEVMDKRGD